jgi:hypothetical protein
MTLAIDIPATGGKTERNGVLRFVGCSPTCWRRTA